MGEGPLRLRFMIAIAVYIESKPRGNRGKCADDVRSSSAWVSRVYLFFFWKAGRRKEGRAWGFFLTVF